MAVILLPPSLLSIFPKPVLDTRNVDHRDSSYTLGYEDFSLDPFFITLCTHNRACLFGHITEGQMQLNEIGEIVAEEWQVCSEYNRAIVLDRWVIMPNHIHCIVGLGNDAPCSPDHSDQPQDQLNSLSIWLARFKSRTTQRINQLRQTPEQQVWQQHHYEQAIQHQFAFQTLRQYIRTNPHAWQWDKLHPDSPSQSWQATTSKGSEMAQAQHLSLV